MASAKHRLQQVNDHLQPVSSSQVGVFCKTYEHSPGHNVATITFSNPSQLNVATLDLLDKLITTCKILSEDESLRAVILTGAPPSIPGKTPAFIGGADIQALNQLQNAEDARAFITKVHEACVALQQLAVPVIARVHGFALGAGLEIMAVSDLKIATKDSRFGMPEVKIGVPSVAEAAVFPSLIGMGRTRRLIYLGENLPAKVVEEWGMIERVVEDETELDRAVDEWVSALVKMGPKCIRDQKRLMRKWENSSLEGAIQAGIEALGETYADGGKEAREFMKPFLGRR